MVYKIDKGRNYGWSVQEGKHPFRPERKKGPTPILEPVVEHSHTDFRSITGGFVYHGERLPELRGQYVYGDFDTGRIWAFRYSATATSSPAPGTPSSWAAGRSPIIASWPAPPTAS
jgi:hypothetical protein